MRDQELSNRSGVAWQQLAVRPARHAMMGRLDHFLGRDMLLPGRRRTADAEEPGNLRHLQPRLAVQEKMAQHAPRVVILAAALNKAKTGSEQGDLIRREPLLADLCVPKPLIERRIVRSHGIPSLFLDAWPRQYISVALSG
jgi:hypothetical protein